MNIKVILTLVLSLYPLMALGSDKDDYKRSIEQWGENPSATKLYEKMKADTLIVDDIQEVLKKGVFGTSKANASGLRKVSKGKSTVDFEYVASFSTDGYYILYHSRTLSPNEQIPSDATLALLKVTEIDKTYKKYIYQLIYSENKVFQFSLSRQKIVKLSEDKKEQLLHQKRLQAAINSQRPPSINMGDSSPEVAANIETYIAKHKAASSSSVSSVKLPLGAGQHTKKRSFSDAPQFLPKPSSSCDSSSSSATSSLNSSPLSRKTSFAVVDTSSMYGKKETKKLKRINPSPLIKASSVASFDLKLLAKAAKKAQKKREEEKKPKDKKEKKSGK